jgi:hypothetical protein
MKLEFDDSFEILSKNRSKYHQRRTLSGIVDTGSTSLHQKSFSSHLPTLSEELQQEIQKIKEEVEARCLEQKQREMFFNAILGPDVSLNTEDIQLRLNETQEIKESQAPGLFFCCKAWFFKCLKM